MTRVLLIGGSAASRRRLRQVLEAERDIEVVRELGETAAVMSALPAIAPEVVAIDESMLPRAGLAIIELIMSEAPLPILVLSELAPDPNDEAIKEATRRGVLAVAAKPALSDQAGAAALRASVRRLARTAVVRHLRSPTPPWAAQRGAGAAALFSGQPFAASRAGGAPLVELVGIGSSAGGPAALVEILAALPKSFSACILVAQHLPPGFAEPFAAFLQARTPLPVGVARAPRPLAPGQVILAPDNAHLVVVSHGLCVPLAEPHVNGHRPSVDKLLESMARVYQAASAGVILSGIGSDGTAGLLRCRQQGALTIAQDGSSAAVNGMPRSAVESGAAELVLTPPAIAQALLRVCAPAAGGSGSHGG